MFDNYDDIINMPHHVSKKHPQMSIYDRAAQFSPFSALKGLEEELGETARITDGKIYLSEEQKQEIDFILNYLKANMSKKPLVEVTFFSPDEKKEGGKYITLIDYLKKVDDFNNILFVGNYSVPFDDIAELKTENLNLI